MFLKKENFTSVEQSENSEQKGDRWSFLAVLPESSYVHTVHSGQRNQAEAKILLSKSKKSHVKAPFFESDALVLS